MINEKNNFLTVSWLSGLLSAEIFISTGVHMPPLTSENSYFLRSGPQGATLVMDSIYPSKFQNFDAELRIWFKKIGSCSCAWLSMAFPDSKVPGANMGPIWGRQDPGGPHVGPMNFAIWVVMVDVGL